MSLQNSLFFDSVVQCDHSSISVGARKRQTVGS